MWESGRLLNMSLRGERENREDRFNEPLRRRGTPFIDTSMTEVGRDMFLGATDIRARERN